VKGRESCRSVLRIAYLPVREASAFVQSKFLTSVVCSAFVKAVSKQEYLCGMGKTNGHIVPRYIQTGIKYFDFSEVR